MERSRFLHALLIILILLITVDIGLRIFEPRLTFAEWNSDNSAKTDSQRLGDVSSSVDKIADALNSIDNSIQKLSYSSDNLKNINYTLKEMERTLENINRSIEKLD